MRISLSPGLTYPLSGWCTIYFSAFTSGEVLCFVRAAATATATCCCWLHRLCGLVTTGRNRIGSALSSLACRRRPFAGFFFLLFLFCGWLISPFHPKPHAAAAAVSYELDKEKITDGRSGSKHCMVSLRNPGCLDGLVLTTSMPTAQGQMHLVETRQLLDKGHVHAQVGGGNQ